MTVFIAAGEESGDRLGAALIRAIRELCGPRIHFAGVGGHAMAAEGIHSPFPIEDLAIVGFTAIPRKLRTILRRIRETADAVIAAQTDVLVIIDSPDFTHRVARRVRKISRSIPIVDYVSPSVWAWRPGRARAMRAYVDHVLALLPFEPAAHEKLGGPSCTFVGHPLASEIATLRPNEKEASRRLADPPIVLMLPGSRRGEIRRLLDIFAETMGRVIARHGPIDIVLPTVPHLVEEIDTEIATWPVRPRIVVDSLEKRAVFRNARAALAKSGTVTLELALSGVPMVAAYKVSTIEAAVGRRVIQAPSVILANLVIGENIVPEFLQERCTAVELAEAFVPLLEDSPERRAQLAAFARLDDIMQIKDARPADSAAVIVLDLARKGREHRFAANGRQELASERAAD
ncbi:MAG: lipid-A-disaccharide synthase [Rhizobiales bacterium]|nr:lipid-A-disaccharide synthase [Hyphomicrobiales bacterium]